MRGIPNPTGKTLRAATAALAIALAAVISQSAQAQTFTVLHNFTGRADGAYPAAGLTMDKAGNLYGTAPGGGVGYGAVFKMSHKGGGWLFSPLYSFSSGDDGSHPYTKVIIGPDGSVYGTTVEGGSSGCISGRGCGTIFNLKPAATACKTALCGWVETVLYRFSGGSDGAYPYGEVIFDQAGNLYGNTEDGGGSGCSGGRGCGIVFKMTPSSGGQWTEGILHAFTGGNDGGNPYGGLIFDKAGNLYGTTAVNGSYECGTVFQLVPSALSGTGNTLYAFNPSGGDGCTSQAGLIFDQSSNLYGTNPSGGSQGGGTVFELTHSNGTWTETVLYSFTGLAGGGPVAALSMDAAGDLYSTTFTDGAYGYGSVFKLSPSNNGWIYADLHDFTGGSDGGNPQSNLVFDANGNLYGTASVGGTGSPCGGCGVVFEITP